MDKPVKLALFVAKSANKKLGGAATTYAADSSCPEVCPFRASKECYGFGYHARRVWASVSGIVASFVDIANAEAAAIDSCAKPSRNLRVHTLGDCSSADAAAIVAAACERYIARASALGRVVRVWTYTHAWRTVPRSAWGAQVSILASVENDADANLAVSRGWTPARVFGTFPSETAFSLGGVKYIPCPEQTGKAESCSDCRLCFDDAKLSERGMGIAFQAHGPKASTMRARMDV